MFWIQQTGSNHNNSGYRLFYAELESDLSLMPTNKQEGKQDNGDSIANKKVALGSECLVLETGNLYILSSNGWKGV